MTKKTPLVLKNVTYKKQIYQKHIQNKKSKTITQQKNKTQTNQFTQYLKTKLKISNQKANKKTKQNKTL